LHGIILDKLGKSACALAHIQGMEVQPVAELRCDETMSQLPCYRIQIGYTNEPLESYVAREVTIELIDPYQNYQEKPRSFFGIITQIEQVVSASGKEMLNLDVEPSLVTLKYSSTSAVYQHKTSIEIFKQVLVRNGLPRFNLKSSTVTYKRQMCIQYNENDFDFVTRILSEDGLVFYFGDGQKLDTMVVHDASKPLPSTSKKIEFTDQNNIDPGRLQVMGLSFSMLMSAQKVSLATYHSQEAQQLVKNSKVNTARAILGDPSVVEFQSADEYVLKGNALAVHAGQLATPTRKISANTLCPALFMGQEINVAANKVRGMSGDYRISKLSVIADSANRYKCEFEAIPSNLPIYPPKLNKPRISGVHNAVVVGGNDGEPASDAEGRVKVKFFWDQSNDKKDTSCWIKVAEFFAGKSYGGQFLPRVGHEVLVSFLHGDADQPVITGQVYNAKNKPPVGSKNSTKSGLVTKLKGPSNRIEFDDKADNEQLNIYAGKDFHVQVNNQAQYNIDDTCNVSVVGATDIKLKDHLNVDVAKNTTVKAENLKLDIGEEFSANAKTIEITASSKIIMQVGQTQLKMSASGLEISAPKITLKATGAVLIDGLKADITAETKLALKGMQLDINGSTKTSIKGGAMTEVGGGGMLKMQGGMVQIN